MPESIQIINQFNAGIMLTPSEEHIPPGSLVRCQGAHSLSSASFRSRVGSSAQATLTSAHSLHYFSSLWHQGASTKFYRNGAEVKTGLSGNDLYMAEMSPTAGKAAQLFVSGGGSLFKINSSGFVTNWGFAAPASNPSAAVSSGGTLTADAVYQYKITYKNSTTGHRSNANATAASATPTGANLSIVLSSIPDGSAVDSQISTVEIWRTEPGGVAFFYLTSIDTGTTTYTDTGSSSITSVALPTDNLTPYAYFTDCYGPHNASMFWLANGTTGEQGRVYYSPIGRPESLAGFINVTSPSNPLKKLFALQGQLGVIAEDGIYMIGGANPYIPRAVPNSPGTIAGRTAVETPMGLCYAASDGARLFNTTSSRILSPGSVERLFRKESLGGISSFTATTGTYARNEYIVTDGTDTLAFNLSSGRVRSYGRGSTALHYAKIPDILASADTTSILNLETEGQTDDDGTAIPISIESRHFMPSPINLITLQYVLIDINLAGESLLVTLIHDGTSTSLGTISNSSRSIITLNVGKVAQKFGIRLTGSVSAPIELFNITYEYHQPKES